MAKETIKAVKGTVRIGPRISRATYMQAKYIYATKGMSFEERIEELLDKDIEYQMKQKWFLDGLIRESMRSLMVLGSRLRIQVMLIAASLIPQSRSWRRSR